jgi:hypothetical protein
VPSFSITAARITEPCVGACVWASGSHVWNGNIGTLMPKPRNMPPKMRKAVVEARPDAAAGSSVIWNVCAPSGVSDRKYSARKAMSMNAEPNAV